IYSPRSGGTVQLTNGNPAIRDVSPDLRIPTPPSGAGTPPPSGVMVQTPTPLGSGAPIVTPPAPPPAASFGPSTAPGTLPPAQSHSVEDAEGKLESVGMVDYDMQWGAQAGYLFTGHFIYPQQPDKLKTVEGQGPSRAAAMQAVIDKIGR